MEVQPVSETKTEPTGVCKPSNAAGLLRFTETRTETKPIKNTFIAQDLIKI